MAYFEWTEKLETGISEIDFQHRSLVNMINRLEEGTHEPLELARQAVLSITLEQLLDYTSYHFSSEEALMAEAHFAHIQAHQVAHQELKKKVLAFQEKIDSGNDETMELLGFLKSWLESHILVTDMQYVSAMKAAGVSKFS